MSVETRRSLEVAEHQVEWSGHMLLVHIMFRHNVAVHMFINIFECDKYLRK